MNAVHHIRRRIHTAKNILLGGALMLFSSLAFAAPGGDPTGGDPSGGLGGTGGLGGLGNIGNTPKAPFNIVEMLQNIDAQLPALTQLVTAAAYVSGMFLVFSAIVNLKELGERAMSAPQGHLKKPLTKLTVGACLIFLPTIINVGMITIFGTVTPLTYPDNNTGWFDMMQTIVLIVQFVGGIAVIRGLYQFNELGSGGGQQVTFGKALSHVIGGIICLNIVGAAHILFTTLGID